MSYDLGITMIIFMSYFFPDIHYVILQSAVLIKAYVNDDGFLNTQMYVIYKANEKQALLSKTQIKSCARICL